MKKKLAKTASPKGTLHTIAGLLVASAFMRIAAGGTELVAESAAPPEVADVSTSMDADPEMSVLLESFRAREARLDEREAQVADRLQALRVSEAEIDEKLTALTAAEEALRATLALADSASDNDLVRLAVVYENMKPRDAAALFTEMSPEFAAGFLGLMQPEAAAAVMTELEAPVSYAISVMLAGRNAGVPTQ